MAFNEYLFFGVRIRSKEFLNLTSIYGKNERKKSPKGDFML
jgi:hypothetical protein